MSRPNCLRCGGSGYLPSDWPCICNTPFGDLTDSSVRLVADARDACWADTAPHAGGHVWKNSAELVWECNDDCPHPSHDDETTPASFSEDNSN